MGSVGGQPYQGNPESAKGTCHIENVPATPTAGTKLHSRGVFRPVNSGDEGPESLMASGLSEVTQITDTEKLVGP